MSDIKKVIPIYNFYKMSSIKEKDKLRRTRRSQFRSGLSFEVTDLTTELVAFFNEAAIDENLSELLCSSSRLDCTFCSMLKKASSGGIVLAWFLAAGLLLVAVVGTGGLAWSLFCIAKLDR